MRKNVERAMDALFAGRDARPAHSIFTEQRGEFVHTVDNDVRPYPSQHQMEQASAGSYRPTVYSYGHHFPLAILLANGDVALSTRKYSATTSTQQSGAAQYLYQHGYRLVGRTADVSPNVGPTYDFVTYRQVR